MASTAITPTRMVLNQLKGRLRTARRGHKLLKDKRDELMRQFMEVIKQNKILRTRVEEGLTAAFGSLQVASSIMSPEVMEQSLLYPRQSVELSVKYKNVMSVNVPEYSFTTSWMMRWSSWQRFLTICWSWRKLKRPCSFLRRKLKKPDAALTLLNIPPFHLWRKISNTSP